MGEAPIPPTDSTKAARPGNFQVTPLMVNDTLFLSTPFNRVVALDANTGRELWSYDPGAYRFGQPSNGTGFVHRGVVAWSECQDGNAVPMTYATNAGRQYVVIATGEADYAVLKAFALR